MYSYTEIIDCDEEVAELEALQRWSMVLHNQYPWDRSEAELVPVSELGDDDYVVVFHPRNAEVRHFLRRVGSGPAAKTARSSGPRGARRRCVRTRRSTCAPTSRCTPRIEALAAVHGDQVCTNEDLIRNTAYNWSPMSAEEIRAKTGIEAAPLHLGQPRGTGAAGRPRRRWPTPRSVPKEIGAVLVCTCTSSRLIPSVATWLSRPARHPADPRAPSTSSPPAPACPTGWPRPPGAAAGAAAGAGGLRGEVLRQDRQRPPIPDDLRRRRGRDRPRRRARRVDRPISSYLQTYASGPVSRGQLDHLAQPRVRQQHHRLRP